MAAAEHASFLDATLTGADTDSRLLSMRADSTPAFREDRVVPLLLRDILNSMQVRQRLHLRLLQEQLEDLIEYDSTTQEEYESLLCMLFSFAHRRGGLTPLQKKHNNETSDVAFSILHRLLGTHHLKKPLVLDALRSLCSQLGCPNRRTGFDHVEEVDGAPQLAEEYAQVVDHLSAQIQEVEQQQSLCAAAADAASTSAVAKMVEQLSGTIPEFSARHPFWYSIDVLPAEERVGLTELEFCETVQWFAALPEVEGSDERDISAAVESGARIGGRYIVAEQANRILRSAEGSASLLNVLRCLHPLCPEQTLLKRIHGMLLWSPSNPPSPPPTDGASTPAGVADSTNSGRKPPTRVVDFNMPTALQRAHSLSLWIVGGQPAPTGDYAHVLRHMVEWCSAVDFTHSGAVLVDGIIGESPWEAAVRSMSVRLRKTRLTYTDIALQAFPGEMFAAVKDAFSRVVKAVEKEYVAHTKRRQELNTTYKLALLKFVEFHEGDNPGGDAETAMTLAGNIAMRDIAAAQRVEYQTLCQLQWRLAALAAARRSLEAQCVDARAQQTVDIRTAQLRMVEPLAGPAAPPPTVDIAGFSVNRCILELSPFAEDASTRSQLTDVLSHLDRSGVQPRWFLADASSLPLLLPHASHCEAGRVYRDFAFCSPRPPIGGPWTSAHRLKIVTNIPRHSDIKYRFVVEGYNFGTNKCIFSVIVGFASASLEHVGALEKFGWPDGWDRSAVINYGGGFENVTQHYNNEGYVEFEAEAHSFSKIGFGVSAWLCNAGYGTEHPLALTVEHL